TAVTDTTIGLTWDAVEGAADYTVYRDGAPVATVDATSHTDDGLTAGASHTYAVAARDADGTPGRRSAPLTARTTGAAAACWTATNYAHVQAGRATTRGGHTYANGPGQHLRPYNTFVTRPLQD